MQKTIILISLYFITSTIFGQNSIEVTYQVISNTSYKAVAILKIDNDKSHYTVLKNKNGLKKIKERVIDGQLNLLIPDSDRRPQVFTDISTKLLISSVPMFRKNNILKEQLPKINWKIVDEFKKIGDYTCQKAIGYFRGRNYTTYFTTKIPVPFGPWKLQGLPGLIIEATDEKAQFSFNVTSIRFKEHELTINIPSKEKAIPFRKFFEVIVPNKFKALDSKFNSRNGDRNTTVTSKIHRDTDKEMIYEWEEKQN